MTAQTRATKAQKEGRLLSALQAYRKNQNQAILALRRPIMSQKPPSSNVTVDASHALKRVRITKLTPTEEQALLEWILDLDERGYLLRIQDLRSAAKLLLNQRDANGTIGINWPTNSVKRKPEIKAKFNRKYDYERALSEDPKRSWA
jgi:Tc5 transposase DNA-binding domain